MRRSRVALLILLLSLALLPLVLNDYQIGILSTAAIFVIVAVGLNLLCGGIGQFSLGHAGFYAIGAFTAGLLATQHGWPFWLQVPVAGVVAALCGGVVGVPVLRLSGPYLAIATLGFGLLVTDVLSTADWAGGRTGITLAPAQLGAMTLSDRGLLWVTLAVAVGATLIVHNLRRGATGRALVALRESEAAAQASGIDVARYRLLVFVISAGCAGIGGALYANAAHYVSADSFSLSLSVLFIAMIVVGGLDNTAGAVVGAVALTLLREALQSQPQIADALYGALIILVLLFVRGGLVGGLRALPLRRPLGARHG